MEGEEEKSQAGDETREQNNMSQDDSGRMLSFVLRTGKVQVKNIRYEDGELILTMAAKVAPESLKEFSSRIEGLAGTGKPAVGKETLKDEIASGETEVIHRPDAGEDSPAAKPAMPGSRTVAHIRYLCPKCKTPGAQPGDKIGSIVTCRRCGKAMRLTVKR